MQSDAKQVEINEFAERFIQKTAKGLVGKAGLTESDIEDIQQDMRLALLQHLQDFDLSRGHVNKFIACVVRTQAKKIIEYRLCDMRDPKREEFSLDDKIPRSPFQEATYGDLTSGKEDTRRPIVRSERDRRDMEIDVATMLAKLPKKVRRLCELVKTMTVRDAAKRLKMPEVKAYQEIHGLRDRFRRAGLEDYLGHPR